MKPKNLTLATLAGASLLLPHIPAEAQPSADRPNILWITSEDNSPFLGCYGDEYATTPNLDKLASEGFRYTHAYANAPVCAPTRNTIITGVYACSGGNQHMRSNYPKSETVRFYPQFLREAGYYCTNNSKEDYNLPPGQTKNIWDESSRTAHYKNRQPGQPFFAIFNSTISHESSIHQSVPTDKLRHDPRRVKLPPYHPDTPEMRHDWAQYYDKLEELDTWVGEILQELEASGEAENTIVFYYGDHGGVLARSKRYVYESGTRVPFIVRIPEKYKELWPASQPGTAVDRLISFVDLSPTLLSLIGTPIPQFLQGQAFLGKQKTADPEYAFMFRDRMDERYDLSRAVRDKKFRYIRNYMPFRIYGQHLEYLWKAPSIRSWEEAWLAGKCNEIQSRFWQSKPVEELYDTENDPWEVNNLAANPAYREVLERMRKASLDWSIRIFDTGFLPEADRSARAGKLPFYDYFRSGSFSFNDLVAAADVAARGEAGYLEQLQTFLKSKDSGIRYWGATGLLILGKEAAAAQPLLRQALGDSSPNVAVTAAEALYNLGEKKEAIQTLKAALKHHDEFARCHALNAIDCTGISSPDVQQAVIDMVATQKTVSRQKYDLRAAKWLIEKWKLDPAKYRITFDW